VFVVELSVTGGGVTRFRLGEFETSSVRECFLRATVAQGEDEIDRFAAVVAFERTCWLVAIVQRLLLTCETLLFIFSL
jgi:hypothetical protein